MESEGVPERVHVSDTTYNRSRKDPDLRFVPDDTSRHSNGQIEGYEGNSWLAVIPGRVEGYKKTITEWIDELFPLDDEDDEDDNDDVDEIKNNRHDFQRSDSRKHSYKNPVDGDGDGDDFNAVEAKEGNHQSNRHKGNNRKGGGGGGDSGGVQEIEMVGMKSEHRRSSSGGSGVLKKVTRTASMQAILDGEEEPRFEGIPTFEGKSGISRKKNKERIHR
jgi:hypothetical protein